MEEIYERLCWLYTTVQNTLEYYHCGNNYYLSDLIGLSGSEGKIPYPKQFANKPDHDQKSLLQGLQMKNVLCQRPDWINQLEGRDTVYSGDNTNVSSLLYRFSEWDAFNGNILLFSIGILTNLQSRLYLPATYCSCTSK